MRPCQLQQLCSLVEGGHSEVVLRRRRRRELLRRRTPAEEGLSAGELPRPCLQGGERAVEPHPRAYISLEAIAELKRHARSSSRSSTPINPMRNNAPQRVSTLRDLSAPAPAGPSRGGFGTGGPSSDVEEDAEQAEFFTGGEKSGLSVENPNAKRKGNPAGGASDSVKGILQKAKEYVQLSYLFGGRDNLTDADNNLDL